MLGRVADRAAASTFEVFCLSSCCRMLGLTDCKLRLEEAR